MSTNEVSTENFEGKKTGTDTIDILPLESYSKLNLRQLINPYANKGGPLHLGAVITAMQLVGRPRCKDGNGV
jgi:hypothetical protein